jgi:hypothetical protein
MFLLRQRTNILFAKHFTVVVAVYQINNYLVAYNIVDIAVASWSSYGVAYLVFHVF